MIRLAMLAEHADDGQSVDGGVQAVTKYLVEELAKSSQLDVHVISLKYGADKIETRDAKGYTRHLIPAAKLGAFSQYRRDQRTVDAFLAKLRPAIVHSQGAGHYGILAARSPYPTVITIHGIMSEEAKHAANIRLKFRRWFISRLSDRLCIGRDKNTILISPYVADYYGDRLSGPQFLIPNPIAPVFFSVARSERPGRILFAGRLLPLKGVHDLLVATASVAKLQNVELVLAGSLDNREFVAKLKSDATRLGIQDVIQFRGILNEAELLSEFARAAVLVLPSYQETAPMVIQEAMAAEVPVIATRVGGIPHQIIDGKTGFIFEPGDVQHLTQCLSSLLTDDALRQSVATAAGHHAKNHYQANTVAARTIEVYRQVLGEP